MSTGDLVDNIVRTAMKQYRDLAKDPHAKERAYRRADSETQEAINSVLVLLHKCDSRGSAADTPPPPGPLAIMDKDPEIKVVLPDPPPPPRKPALRISPKSFSRRLSTGRSPTMTRSLGNHGREAKGVVQDAPPTHH